MVLIVPFPSHCLLKHFIFSISFLSNYNETVEGTNCLFVIIVVVVSPCHYVLLLYLGTKQHNLSNEKFRLFPLEKLPFSSVVDLTIPAGLGINSILMNHDNTFYCAVIYVTIRFCTHLVAYSKIHMSRNL